MSNATHAALARSLCPTHCLASVSSHPISRLRRAGRRGPPFRPWRISQRGSQLRSSCVTRHVRAPGAKEPGRKDAAGRGGRSWCSLSGVRACGRASEQSQEQSVVRRVTDRAKQHSTSKLSDSCFSLSLPVFKHILHHVSIDYKHTSGSIIPPSVRPVASSYEPRE